MDDVAVYGTVFGSEQSVEARFSKAVKSSLAYAQWKLRAVSYSKRTVK